MSSIKSSRRSFALPQSSKPFPFSTGIRRACPYVDSHCVEKRLKVLCDTPCSKIPVDSRPQGFSLDSSFATNSLLNLSHVSVEDSFFPVLPTSLTQTQLHRSA